MTEFQFYHHDPRACRVGGEAKGIPCNSNSDSDKDHFAPNPHFPGGGKRGGKGLRTQEAIELGMAGGETN